VGIDGEFISTLGIEDLRHPADEIPYGVGSIVLMNEVELAHSMDTTIILLTNTQWG
jgi:hypothetical protein